MTNDTHGSEHTYFGPQLWQLWSVWEIYYSTAVFPHLVYLASTLKESVKKAMVVEHSWSAEQSCWIMVLIVSYWGQGKKGRLKLKAKPESIRHVVNRE